MPFFDAERNIIAGQIRNRMNEIAGTVYSDRRAIPGWEYVVTGHKQGPAAPPKSGWEPFQIGSSWGGLDVTTWFRTTVTVPEEMDGKKVVLLIRPGGEALAYINGRPVQGLDGNRDEITLAQKAKAGDRFEVMVEAYSNPRFHQIHTFQYADIAVLNEEVRSFLFDVRVAAESALTMPENSAIRGRIFNLLDRCVKMVDLQHIGLPEYFDSIKRARKELNEGLKEFQNSYGMGSLLLAGHSHIDTAWLWPLRETQRKCARTFSTVLKYMEEYPEYHFTQSQPQLYEFTKKYYPEIYEGIKRRVKEGRWEPIGATWVEQDSNISSGESLVRQLLYGNRFFRKEFGIHSRVCWLPDAFGFTWSLPQLLKKAGVDYFVTTKIDWSQYNKFPYSLFWWQGIDGTKVVALMPPLNYNGNVVPRDCLEQWNRFKQKDIYDEVIFSFGHGDGGGGPTKEMLENGLRLKNMAGIPRCRFGKVQDYFDRLEKNLDKSKLPVWNGELYLELHRACQTTQGRTKRNNRKSELLYRDAEIFSSVAMLLGKPYQQEKLYEGWKIILCNQFHDILPGSSIGEVYEDADRDYAKVLKAGGEVLSDALKAIASRIDTSGDGEAIVIFNTLSWTRSDVASLKVEMEEDDFTILDPSGEPVPAQIVRSDGKVKEILFEASEIPPLGYSVYRLIRGRRTRSKPMALKVDQRLLENAFFRVKLNDRGQIISLYDKLADREVLAENGRGNVLELFDDRPHAHDAWDIDFNYEEIRWEVDQVESIEVAESGPVRAAIRVKLRTERSSIDQLIAIYDTIPRIDFITHVDWHEKRTLMKVAFEVDVLSPKATYEIQFGAIERPTHQNTSWDRAKFEVPAQRWADLSETGYGVSILNDCKYGHSIKDNVIRLSLLRSPISPDPNADQGEHFFIYSLYPHKGDWRDARTVRRAYELNAPLIAHLELSHPGDLPSSSWFAAVDGTSVVIEAIKKAEDTDDLILRLYESHGWRGKVRIKFSNPPHRVFECNLMEEDDEELKLDDGAVDLYVKPYEVKTLKLRFRS